jgi:hypothetical protein
LALRQFLKDINRKIRTLIIRIVFQGSPKKVKFFSENFFFPKKGGTGLFPNPKKNSSDGDFPDPEKPEKNTRD